MPTYRTFSVPNPDPDAGTVKERIALQEVALQNFVMPLVAELAGRVEDQEDELRPIYRKLVDVAKMRVYSGHQALANLKDRVASHARTKLARQSAMLMANPTFALAAATTDEPIAAPVPPPVTLPPAGDGAGSPTPICPPGYTLSPPDAAGVQHCIPGRPPVAPPVPPVVLPPSGLPGVPPLPPPAADTPPVPPGVVCTPIESGTIRVDVPDKFWLYVDCRDCREAKYRVVKCPCTPPATVGETISGPFEVLPTAEQITAAVKACAAGGDADTDKGKCPPADKPPAEEPPAEEPPAGEGDTLPFPIRVPPALIDKPLDCTLLNFDDPRLCECLPDYVKWFGELGQFIRGVAGWLAQQGKILNDLEIIKIEAALFRNVLRVIGAKFGYNDPTIYEAADQWMRWQEARFGEFVEQEVTNAWAWVKQYSNDSAGPRADSLYGMYLARAFLDFVETQLAGWLVAKHDGPSLGIQFTHLRRLIELCVEWLYPLSLPRLGDVEDLWRQGVITDQQAGCLVNLHGEQWSITRRAWFARRQLPTADDLVQWKYRDRPTPTEFQNRLRAIGYLDPADVNILERTRVWLPTPSDAIRIGRRDAFDPNKLGRAEMLAEMAEQPGLKELFEAIGLEKTHITTKDGRRVEIDTPALYWLSDYEEASPTQVYEMFHRLRPGREHLYPLPGPGGKTEFPNPVTIDVVQKLLKEKDYNPIWRNRLAAIAYRVIGRIDIRRMYGLGVFGKPLGKDGWNTANAAKPLPLGVAEKELIERYLDQGSTPSDAAIQGLFTSLDFSVGKLRKTQTRKQAVIAKAYRIGAIDADTARTQLATVTGSAELAADLVTLADAEVKNAAVDETIRSVRSLYVSGKIDATESRAALTATGIRQAKVGELMGLWDIRLAGRRKEIAAGQLCSYYAMGLVTRDEFKTRLMRFGYPEGDANRIIRKCELGELAKTAKQIAREAALAQRQREAQRKAEQSAVDRLQRDADKRLAKFLATRSDKNLIAYFKDGSITELEIRSTLALRPMTGADIDRWVSAYLKPPGTGQEG